METDTTNRRGYVSRVLHNDSTKKGVAAAAAGLLVSCVMEAIWPSE